MLSPNLKGRMQFAPTDSSDIEKSECNSPRQVQSSIWQRDYYEHIIRTDKSYQRISDYIIENPARWEDDKFYLD